MSHKDEDSEWPASLALLLLWKSAAVTEDRVYQPPGYFLRLECYVAQVSELT